jgi:hypothetical protein
VSKFLKQNARNVSGLIYFLLSCFLVMAVKPSQCLGQRLIIETPNAGPVARVFYGQITLQDFILFEKRNPFELDISRPGPDGSESPPTDDIPPSITQGSTLATFNLKTEELAQCTASMRFKGFLELSSALKGRMNSARIHVGPDTDSCADKVSAALKKALGDIKVISETSYTDGIKIELGLIVEIPKKKSQPIVYEAEPLKITLEQLLEKSILKIGTSQVRILKNGWFVFEVTDNSEQTIELKAPGRKIMTIKSIPMLLSSESKPVIGATSYKARVAVFGKPALAIYVSETPFLSDKTTIDGGGGGGLGYGRQIPGERKGERIVAMTGLERRDIFKNLGARTSLFYTNASRTVVPHTFTARAIGFYDFDIEDDSWAARISAGMEIFYSHIRQDENPKDTSNKSAIIPSQVSSPVLGLSAQKVVRGAVTLGSSIFVTPLYVNGAGFYPSLSPHLELGYKLQKNAAIILAAGSEIHRFPSVVGETKLQLDYLLLNFKRGLF